MDAQAKKDGSDKSNTRHHFVAKMYLEGFTGVDGKLGIWSRADGIVRLSTPANTANARGFYTFTDPDGKKSGALEDAFAEIEGRAAVIIRHTDTIFPPVFIGQIKSDMAAYIALQYVRTPERRRAIEEMADLTLKLEMMTSINNRGDESEVAKQFLDNPHAVRASIGKESILKYQMESLPLISAILAFRKWEVVMFDNPCLIASDSPLLLKPDPEMPPFYGVGLTNAKEIWFPLSSTRMIVMSNQDYKPEGVLRGSQRTADIANSNQARSSYIEAYGPPDVIKRLEGKAFGNRPTFTVETGLMKDFFDPYNQPPDNPRPHTR